MSENFGRDLPSTTPNPGTGTRGLGPAGLREGLGDRSGKGWRQQEVCNPALHDATQLPPKRLPTALVTCLYLLQASEEFGGTQAMRRDGVHLRELDLSQEKKNQPKISAFFPGERGKAKPEDAAGVMGSCTHSSLLPFSVFTLKLPMVYRNKLCNVKYPKVSGTQPGAER